jgi:hypothetical protein
MKVRVREIQYRDVELTREQVDEITIQRLKTLTGGGEFLRERKGVLFVMKLDPDHRHGSVDEVIVREATPMDIKIFEVINYFYHGYFSANEIFYFFS